MPAFLFIGLEDLLLPFILAFESCLRENVEIIDIKE